MALSKSDHRVQEMKVSINRGRTKMASTVENWSKSEIRAAVRLLYAYSNTRINSRNGLASGLVRMSLSKEQVH